MTRAQDYNYVEDNGLNSFVVGHLMNKLPADVEVQGLLDAAVLGAPGAGVRTHKDAREGLNKINLNDVFGTGLPPGFIGIFENQDPTDLHTYVVVRSNVDNDNLWYAYQLAGPLA
jgi:hypothetical protein